MSNIFDALQKTEAEQSGDESLHDVEATQLLRRAERRATARWEQSLAQVNPAMTPPEGPNLANVATAVMEGRVDFEEIESFKVSSVPDARLVALMEADSPAAEAFRLLTVRLQQIQRNRAIKRLLITSTIPQEGKSVVAANLACTLAL